MPLVSLVSLTCVPGASGVPGVSGASGGYMVSVLHYLKPTIINRVEF